METQGHQLQHLQVALIIQVCIDILPYVEYFTVSSGARVRNLAINCAATKVSSFPCCWHHLAVGAQFNVSVFNPMDCEEGKQKEDNQLIVLFFSQGTSEAHGSVSFRLEFLK